MTGPAAGFLGDDPTAAHTTLHSPVTVPSPRERADLVVIGGGISGLATAWRLRDRKPIVLERAPRFGGNSQGERWGGLEYSVGAAYFAFPPPGSLLVRRFYRPLGLHRLWRQAGPESVLYRGEIVDGFWSGRTDPSRADEFRRVARWFRTVSANGYPDMPPGEWKTLTEAELFRLDRQTFRAALEAANGGGLHPHIEGLLQHYCWSSFGGGIDEISAAAGLNFYCAEFDGMVALPGGNSRVAAELLRGLDDVRANTTVLRVIPRADGVTVVAVDGNGPYAIDARAAVVACPKFVAARIVEGLPETQVAAMRRIRYRAYLVANVLIDAPGPADAMGIYLVPEGKAAVGAFTDFVVAAWAAKGHPERSVLTLYRALPYDGGRTEIIDDASFSRVQGEFAAQVRPVLAALGIAENAVREIRVHRWGHPLPLAEPGRVADGTLAAARATVGGRVFFVEQDDWALPALETCLVRVLEEEQAIRKASTAPA